MTKTFTTIDSESLWFLCWRIKGDLCGRTLHPMKPDQLANIMEKACAVYGRKNVWIERSRLLTGATPRAAKAAEGQHE